MKALRFLPWLAVAAALAVAASGFGARFGVWHFGVGFTILRWGAYAGLTVAAIALIALLIPRLRTGSAMVLVAAIAAGLAAAALPLYWIYQSRTVPPINDISTDTVNPPAFVAILPRRADAPVDANYPGEASAQAQRLAYPDIKTITFAVGPDAAFAKALLAARNMGWEIVAAVPAAGRIEATATTSWYGFKDDVVIRVTPDGAGSRLDIRSLSRIGTSDMGVNAARIRAFVAALTP